MGFWGVIGRLFQGKPAFESPPQPKDDWEGGSPSIDFAEERAAKRDEVAGQADLHDDRGYKHIPVVRLSSVKNDPSRDLQYFDLWVTLENDSDRQINVEKVVLLGSTTELHIPLEPHAKREVRIYRGRQLTHGNYKKAGLYYKDTLAGDYFRADHMIHYKYEADKTYDINDFDLIMPINDI